ncbi:MAG: SRPBCC domain-containing protein [Bacteroidota bacterium]
MNGFSIHHDFIITCSINKVYRALTEPELLIKWWPLKCSGKPIEGEIYNFNFTDAYDWYGEVIKAEENKSFHVKMTKSDENWNATSFGFDLIETNGNTEVRFFHINWPSCNAEFRKSSYCWAILLQGLKNYLEKEIVIPFEERE